jgi:hypothetical protein
VLNVIGAPGEETEDPAEAQGSSSSSPADDGRPQTLATDPLRAVLMTALDLVMDPSRALS